MMTFTFQLTANNIIAAVKLYNYTQTTGTRTMRAKETDAGRRERDRELVCLYGYIYTSIYLYRLYIPLKAAANAMQVLPQVSKNNHFEITSKIQTAQMKYAWTRHRKMWSTFSKY